MLWQLLIKGALVPNQRQVKIIDAKTGAPLRETYISEEKKLFNIFTLPDIIHISSVWIAIIGLVVGMDYRIKSLEADKVIVSVGMAKLADFVKASDNFNSSFFGTQFDNGKPINPAYIK